MKCSSKLCYILWILSFKELLHSKEGDDYFLRGPCVGRGKGGGRRGEGGGGRGVGWLWLCYNKIYQIAPLGLCNTLIISSHWRSISPPPPSCNKFWLVSNKDIMMYCFISKKNCKNLWHTFNQPRRPNTPAVQHYSLRDDWSSFRSPWKRYDPSTH